MSNIIFVGDHYLLGEKIYKVASINRGKAEIIVQNIETGDRFNTPYDTFFVGYERVLKIGAVCDVLNRSPRSIYRYEAKSQIKNPNRYLTKSGKHLRFYTKQDVLEMREMIADIHQGRPNQKGKVINNTVPTKYEVIQALKERHGVV